MPANKQVLSPQKYDFRGGAVEPYQAPIRFVQFIKTVNGWVLLWADNPRLYREEVVLMR